MVPILGQGFPIWSSAETEARLRDRGLNPSANAGFERLTTECENATRWVILRLSVANTQWPSLAPQQSMAPQRFSPVTNCSLSTGSYCNKA
jgi:hypothetical protein